MKPWIIILAIVIGGAPALSGASEEMDVNGLIRKMESAYAAVNDYRTNLEVREYAPDGAVEEKKLRYTYRKPGLIRLDFEQPHEGMVIVYPDRDGKVAVRPVNWLPFVILHKEPGDPQAQVSPGQRIDQTDLGLLIKNIKRSVNEGRKGPVTVSSDDNTIAITVLAEDHFLPNKQTLYTFVIDKTLWLPVETRERDPEGRLKRTVSFHDLRVNLGFPEAFFHLD